MSPRPTTLLVPLLTGLLLGTTGATALEQGHLRETYTVTLNGVTYRVPVDYYVWKNGDGHFVWLSLGVHPLEHQAHECMFHAAQWFVRYSGEFRGTLIVSWIRIPKEYYTTGDRQRDYQVSRDLGQLTFHHHVLRYVLHPEELGRKVGVRLTGRPELFLDVHAHRPWWGASEFILIPAGPVHGNDNPTSYRKALQICEALAGVIGASVDPNQKGTSPPWVTAPVARAGIPAATFENGYYYLEREMPANYDNYRTELDKALLEALYLYALEGGRVSPTPEGYRKLAHWYEVAAGVWDRTARYLELAADQHPDYADVLRHLSELARRISSLLRRMSDECRQVAALLEAGNRREAARLVDDRLLPEYNEVRRLYAEYIEGYRRIPVRIVDVVQPPSKTERPWWEWVLEQPWFPVAATVGVGVGALAVVKLVKTGPIPILGLIACAVPPLRRSLRSCSRR